ncbi:MAG: nickel pincer cofactor biosynthesis protein LarC [candidate division Zixibacteria bacterium]|nr:nickel pincer cofactor biosynthesis protein LarC [candidate division Zixibacteria bacterium]
MKILYFDCFSGISGDMTVGAMLNLGMPFDYLEENLKKLNLSGYKLEQSITERHKISATKFDVIVTDDKGHRHLKDITEIIKSSDLSDRIKDISYAAFERLARAEAKIHNSTPDKVHFHEVGGIDAIIDIVGSAIGAEYFAPDSIYCSTVTLGQGTTTSSHGVIPIPAPATTEILKNVPTKIAKTEGERVTPTGAAILTALIDFYDGGFECPEMLSNDSGFGAGTKNYDDCPNLLRIILGDSDKMDNTYIKSDKIDVLETNIDDMNPQIYNYVFSKIYDAGAYEVFLTPVIMKKNRPGHILTVLCKNDLSDKICGIIFNETSTAGIRFRSESRRTLDRKEKVIETRFGQIRVKILKLKDGFKIQPEYDDCRDAAENHKVPLRKIIETVRRQAEIEEGKIDEH